MDGAGGMVWHKVARLADVPLGTIRSVGIGGEPVLLCRAASGIHALADRCPHAGQPLREGRIRGESIVCPFHGARFALADGAPLGGPTREAVRTYPVRVEGEDILVGRRAG